MRTDQSMKNLNRMKKTFSLDDVLRIEKYATRLREDIVTYEKTGNKDVYDLMQQYLRIIISICEDFTNN